jgi:hypothetical protein
MLFLLKRTVAGGFAGLFVLSALGFGLRFFLGDRVPPLTPSMSGALTGCIVVSVVLLSDGVLHGTLLLTWGEPYRRGYRELASVFRQQSFAAMVIGSLMAATGEELVFRGLSSSPFVLFPAALLFGLLHHIRRSLWGFTLWSIWEGTLFAVAMVWTGDLFVTMVAHFLHDLLGFLAFRWENRRSSLVAY